jgi:hypothetical protein
MGQVETVQLTSSEGLIKSFVAPRRLMVDILRY